MVYLGFVQKIRYYERNRYEVRCLILDLLDGIVWRLRILTAKTLLCGCVYEETEWMLVRIRECEKHHKDRNKKVEYRPKSECCRNDTRGE
jgi:hypothetical protein